MARDDARLVLEVVRGEAGRFLAEELMRGK